MTVVTGQGRTSGRRAASAEKKVAALRLRAAGASRDDIAAELGVHPVTAWRYIRDAIVELPREPAEEVRTLELERLDAMQAALWPMALRGEVQAIDRVLKIMERRARYLGLDEQTSAAPPDEQGGGVPLRELFAQDPQRALDVARWLHDNLPTQPPRVIESDAS